MTSRGVAIGRISVIGGRRIVIRIAVIVWAAVPRSDTEAGATEAQVSAQTLCFRRAQWKHQCAQTQGREDQCSHQAEPVVSSGSRHVHLQILADNYQLSS